MQKLLNEVSNGFSYLYMKIYDTMSQSLIAAYITADLLGMA